MDTRRRKGGLTLELMRAIAEPYAPCQKCERYIPKRLIIFVRGPFGALWLDPLCALQELRKINNKPALQFTGKNKEKYDETLSFLAATQEARP